MTKLQKQSLILGALTSSFGIFLSKALGLLYAAPFSALAGEANMSFYATSYNYYNFLLNICSAGIPFAVATMVAKYYDREDYKSVLLVRKLANALLLSSGFIIAIVFVVIAKPFASFVLSDGTNPQDIEVLRNVFVILAVAIACVPFLSGIRGFHQGLGNMKMYSLSQVLEQLVRVIFLLAAGFAAVNIFSLDSVYALYAGVLAASVAAIVTIAYHYRYTKSKVSDIERLALTQKSQAKENRFLLKEIVWFGVPYVLIATLGDSMNLINSSFFMGAMDNIKVPYEEAKLLLGMIQFNSVKLTAIPQVLALGFSAAIVPYITVHYENNRIKLLRKSILDVLDTVLYISLPLSFCLLVLARPIYSLMYGNAFLDLGSEVLMWSSSLALLGTIAPVCSSLMMNLRMRKKVIIFLLINFLIKSISFYPMIMWFGYPGAILSSVVSSFANIGLALYTMGKKYKINYIKLVFRIIVMVIGLLSMNGAFTVLNFMFNFEDASKLLLLLYLAIYGAIGILAYVMTTGLFGLPQKIFKWNFIRRNK